MKLLDIVKLIINIVSVSVPFLAYFFLNLQGLLWDISLIAVATLMCIRPLNDIFPNLKMYRFLTLRKNLGILSAMVVVSYGIIHYIEIYPDFFQIYFSLAYWSFKNNLFWAHLGEITGLILLITSNRLSVRILKTNWKRIQRLSYVYFFPGAWYVFSTLGKTYALICIIVVFELTLFAYLKKRLNKKLLAYEQQINYVQLSQNVSYGNQ